MGDEVRDRGGRQTAAGVSQPKALLTLMSSVASVVCDGLASFLHELGLLAF